MPTFRIPLRTLKEKSEITNKEKCSSICKVTVCLSMKHMKHMSLFAFFNVATWEAQICIFLKQHCLAPLQVPQFVATFRWLIDEFIQAIQCEYSHSPGKNIVMHNVSICK